MAQKPAPVEDDPLPPARPARSRHPSTADAAHQEVVLQRREQEAAQTVGSPLDVDSPRLQARRAHKQRLASQPLYSKPRAARALTPESLDGTADNTMASTGGEFDPLSDDAVTADMETQNANE